MGLLLLCGVRVGVPILVGTVIVRAWGSPDTRFFVRMGAIISCFSRCAGLSILGCDEVDRIFGEDALLLSESEGE